MHSSKNAELIGILKRFNPALLDKDPARLALWSAAFSAWLATLSQASDNWSKVISPWKLLLEFHSCLPWELDRAKVNAWLEHLTRTGHTSGTIVNYRRRIAGFFTFCASYPGIFARDPLFAPGQAPFNPVQDALPARTGRYDGAYILFPAEARALLRAVDRQNSLLARRDYAFLITLLLTAVPHTRLRLIRWDSIRVTAQGVLLHVAGEAFPLHPLAWDAIHSHLKFSGRLETIRPQDYLFCPLAEPLLHPPKGLASDWCPGSPLTLEQLNVLLDTYAGWAGLDTSRITFDSLRHTAAALRLDAGANALALQHFLGRRYIRETRYYLKFLGRMLGKRRPPFPRRPSLPRRFSPNPSEPPRCGPSRAQPGNFNGLKHGLYTRRLRPEDLPGPDPQKDPSLVAPNLEGEISSLRYLLRRAFTRLDELDDPQDFMPMLEAFGRSSSRVARLLVEQKRLKETSRRAEIDSAIEQAIAEVAKELGLE